jgi:hypothetical protein
MEKLFWADRGEIFLRRKIFRKTVELTTRYPGLLATFGSKVARGRPERPDRKTKKE